MEHYSKGKNVEEEITKDKIPIPNLPNEFTWMKVRGGSKIRNLVAFANKSFKEEGVIVWTGTGTAASKAVSCAEIMKRTFDVHQITKHSTHNVEEFWDPKLDGLDSLVVTRSLPVVHILLSKEPLDSNEPGYLAPGVKVKKTSRRAPIETLKAEKLSPAEFAELGLQSNTYRRPKSARTADKTNAKPAAAKVKPAATKAKPAATKAKPAATKAKPAATKTQTSEVAQNS